MDTERALEKYRTLRPRYKRAAEDVARIVEQIAAETDIKCRVTGREKEPASFQKKAVLKQYDDPWKMISDKAGVRAIVDRPRHVEDLAAALLASPLIETLRKEDKRQVTHVEHLGYSGIHLQVVAPAETDDTEHIECEVQLRTVAQDAWSVVSHQLLYKPGIPLPAREQRAIYRLVALVELFDEEVQRVMDTIPSLPGYETIDLIDAAESEYIPLAHATSNREFSTFILGKIQAAIGPDERKNYSQRLHAFAAENDATLREIYTQLGPRSDMTSTPHYIMFSQAESVIIFERLTRCPYLLLEEWRTKGLPLEWLKPLISAMAIPIDQSALD
jgi:ppGpp synthetase/RelA/SpoT-type nucleotidyltranferase